MPYLRKTPAAPLDLVVDHLWVFEDFEVSMAGGLLFADGCTDLMFNLSEPLLAVLGDRETWWRDTWISGNRTAPVQIRLRSKRFTIVGVRLRATGVAAVLGAPAVEVADDIVELRELWSRFANEVHDRLYEAPDAATRLSILEASLLRRLQMPAGPKAPFAEVVQRMARTPAEASVSDLTTELGISHKHLTRLFRSHVGLTPKTFLRVCRFRSLLEDLAFLGGAPQWAHLAFHHGFSDQAHLCREFRSFTGMSPTEYRSPGPMPAYLPWGNPEAPALDVVRDEPGAPDGSGSR